MTTFLAWVATALDVLALFGCVAVLASTRSMARLGRASRAAPLAVAPQPVTMLKPLHGDEPRLAENLATFRDQDWDAPIQILAGVARADDPAADIARSIGDMVDVVVDGRRHGANAKIGNIVNMMPAARHDLIVLSDSDIAAPPNYLKHIAAQLADPGIGAVTIAYGGRGDTGFWSRFCAGIVSYHFMPSMMLSLDLGMGDVCMGSTIAMRRETLEAIGGFDRFVDTLADDYAIGQAVRALGLKVVVPPVFVTHASIETSFAEVAKHELRWMATVRTVNAAGHVGSLTLHALPLSLIALLLAPGRWTLAVVIAALITRLVSAKVVDRVLGRTTLPLWLMPLRDLMTFGVHVTSLFVRRVDWRGARLKMRAAGRIEAEGA
ncbi:bacteriohopanetetrol glucosamine biosynthesis glycosyltransferase HpnI [Sphingomonas sp. GlSt437]|uniref:bacteriohopanetetrol glucosamine biosynthesis glycosyltransferase HpnI n=1 Tax=Sphingomonas sp. GlSt437 TaxID=3389970 RepID=UPI003A88A46C